MTEDAEVRAVWALAGMCLLISVAHMIAYLWRYA